MTLPSLLSTDTALVQAATVGSVDAGTRADRSYNIRMAAAHYQRQLPLPDHRSNGDETRYASKIASFSKTLPHNDLGEVEASAYNALMQALTTGRPRAFEAIPLGGVAKLANPQAAFAFELEGPDSHHLSTPPAPAFDSAEAAGEMAELYWAALTRDIPFAEYDAHPLANAAAAELSRLSDFRGPKVDGRVTPGTLFRGPSSGNLRGPYISQFLWRDIPYGAMTIAQRYRTTAPTDDHMVSYADWLAVQRGAAPSRANTYDATPRYIRNGRDLAEWDHLDFTYQGLLNAALILLGMGAARNVGNPYRSSRTQGAFVTYGAPHLLHIVAQAAVCALKATWFQKWLVHRRLRPEAMGGRIHNHLTRAARYPIHDDVLNSQALARVVSRTGTYLLPMAYPEGSPTHPAYPAGHPAIAAAGVTMLKAFFDESFVITNPVQASADGLSLVPYTGQPLTVGGELNKLANNIGIGRNTAGVHYRTDGESALSLGEAVAIGILRDQKKLMNEHSPGFLLTKFDGATIRI